MPPANNAAAAKRALPPKESSLFRELLTLYETKQLKKGIKTADQILKKFPDHGETICMKGLVLTHMGKREEGLDYVKRGIRLDLTSHICWHVFGLIQKGEKKYEEALKSYTQALRFDKENQSILRDTAHLQSQLRLFDGLIETRHTLLRIRPQLRANWVGLAVAYHLNGNLDEAIKVLNSYEKTLKEVPDYDVEHSETLLYHIRLLEDKGDLSEALSMLDVNAKSRHILDRTAIMETRARILTKLGPSNDSEDAWRNLISQNPDNIDYLSSFLSSKGLDLANLSDESRAATLDLLQELLDVIPRANTPRRLALTVSTGDGFKTRAEAYILSSLNKGIPSLFADLKSLYVDSSKRDVVEAIVESHRESTKSAASSSTDTDPTVYLWTLYFLAQHYSFLKQYQKALALLEEAIAHTPTLPELYTCRARVLKRAGDPYGAARSLEEARLLDGQDRFLNTKCGKYRLRAGLIEEAVEIFGMFTRKDAVSPTADLEDMQSLLYLLEEGNAHLHDGRFSLALKRFTGVQKVFQEVDDDQYDYHGYAIRKFNLNAYMRLIAWEDRLYSHPAYIAAAVAASKIYVAVHDDPLLASSSSGLSEADKKAKKKAKKAAQKSQAEAKKATNANQNEDKGLDVSPPKDEDPDGMKLLTAPDGLDVAAKFLGPLVTHASHNLDFWIASYDVAIRRKKYLQAVRAINRAKSIDPEDSQLHLRIIHYSRTITSLPEKPSGPVGEILGADFLPEGLSIEAHHSQFLQQHSHSASALLACAQAAQLLQAPKEEVESIVLSSLEEPVEGSIETYLQLLTQLSRIQSERAEEFREKSDVRFPLSTMFKTKLEKEVLKRRALTITEDTSEGDKTEIVN